MCKENTITTSWAWLGAIVGLMIIGCGIIASSLGAQLTWGEIIIVPFVLTFFLNRKCRYCFTNSGFTIQWMICKHTVLAEDIKQVNFVATKSGTWIVVELMDASAFPPEVSRIAVITYFIKNHRKCCLLPLQWGERDNALEIFRICCPQKIVIIP